MAIIKYLWRRNDEGKKKYEFLVVAYVTSIILFMFTILLAAHGNLLSIFHSQSCIASIIWNLVDRFVDLSAQ